MEKYKKESCKNKFKISAPAWSEEFELPYGSYSVSDIQEYFEYIIKKHETVTEYPSVKIYLNKIENRIMFKVTIGYYLELSMPKIMELLRKIKSKITKDENGLVCLIWKFLK